MPTKKRNVVIDISDAKVSKLHTDMLVTYSLGSCIGVCLYDPSVSVGGMLHYQLPDSKLDAQKAIDRPFMFADTGLKLLLQTMLSMGCRKNSIHVIIAGGASMRNGPSGFEIGKRNYLSIRKCMWKEGLMIHAENVGGNSPRSLYLDIETGRVEMRMNSSMRELK